MCLPPLLQLLVLLLLLLPLLLLLLLLLLLQKEACAGRQVAERQLLRGASRPQLPFPIYKPVEAGRGGAAARQQMREWDRSNRVALGMRKQVLCTSDLMWSCGPHDDAQRCNRAALISGLPGQSQSLDSAQLLARTIGPQLLTL
jgi:hypothetical protein